MTVTCIYIFDTKSHFGNQKTYLTKIQISVKITDFNNVQQYMQLQNEMGLWEGKHPISCQQ